MTVLTHQDSQFDTCTFKKSSKAFKSQFLNLLKSVNDLQFQFFYFSILQKERKVDLVDANTFYYFIPLRDWESHKISVPKVEL